MPKIDIPIFANDKACATNIELQLLMGVVMHICFILRGHHIYEEIWRPYVGEVLICKGNIHDLYTSSFKRSMGNDRFMSQKSALSHS